MISGGKCLEEEGSFSSPQRRPCAAIISTSLRPLNCSLLLSRCRVSSIAFTERMCARLAMCGEACLKVILETGELGTYDKVRLASDIAIAAGADFIKTSTAQINPAATMEVTLVMLHAIRDHYLKTGHMIAMKPAGGIRKSKEALHYLMMVKEELGEEWLSNHWFRFGASSLANDILMQLQKEADGHYQSADYFSID
ncbi:MAG: hypothetical protein IPK70_15915 [Flavobacteriales bacterium]|nr:hypothetical protein [Flavobacteriales bacterium]